MGCPMRLVSPRCTARRRRIRQRPPHVIASDRRCAIERSQIAHVRSARNEERALRLEAVEDAVRRRRSRTIGPDQLADDSCVELALAGTREHSAQSPEPCLGIALAADPAAAGSGARLLGAVAQLYSDADVVMNAWSRATHELERHFERQLVIVLGEEAWEREKTAGSAMTLELAAGTCTESRKRSRLRGRFPAIRREQSPRSPDDRRARNKSAHSCARAPCRTHPIRGVHAGRPSSRGRTST